MIHLLFHRNLIKLCPIYLMLFHILSMVSCQIQHHIINRPLIFRYQIRCRLTFITDFIPSSFNLMWSITSKLSNQLTLTISLIVRMRVCVCAHILFTKQFYEHLFWAAFSNVSTFLPECSVNVVNVFFCCFNMYKKMLSLCIHTSLYIYFLALFFVAPCSIMINFPSDSFKSVREIQSRSGEKPMRIEYFTGPHQSH